MTNNVFVYGSLLADEVVQKLLSRMPKVLPGEERNTAHLEMSMFLELLRT